jgi:hypothetical protein
MPNAEMWQLLAGQALTIVGSIVGIYLAAYTSFKRTLQRDQLVKAQRKADLLTAICEELKQNIARLEKFNERLPADVGIGVTSAEWPQLRLFVWQAAGRTSAAFDIPPSILADMQALYGDLDLMLGDTAAHLNFRSLTTSNTYDRGQFKERLSAHLNHARTSIVAALTGEIAQSTGQGQVRVR